MAGRKEVLQARVWREGWRWLEVAASPHGRRTRLRCDFCSSPFSLCVAQRRRCTSQVHGEDAHTPIAGKYAKSAVLGGLDGIITTFAIVAAVAGGNLERNVVLLLGFANLIADGISMGLGGMLRPRTVVSPACVCSALFSRVEPFADVA